MSRSKIDMRHLNGKGGCPFIGNLSVRCTWNKSNKEGQYVCECDATKPAPQDRHKMED